MAEQRLKPNQMSQTSKLSKVFERQFINIVATIGYSSAVYFYCIDHNHEQSLRSKYVSGLSLTPMAIAIPSIHQFYVAFCWRTELHLKLLTKLCGGSTQIAFNLYRFIFFLFLNSRMMTTFLIAKSTQNSLDKYIKIESKLFKIVRSILMGTVFSMSSYTLYSVVRYFGFNALCGEDHFYPEKYQNKPLCKQGIFKYVDNAIYKYGLSALYLPGLYYRSYNGLVVGCLTHSAIWIHYYCLEVPDMKYIYG